MRFQTGPDEPFLDPDSEVPKLVELPRLMRAADSVARDGGADLAAIKELLDAGSGSLGGARPKASVRDGDRLLIAKFPHPGDEWDVMAWERTALDLAALAGIRTPHTKLLRVDGASVLLLERVTGIGGARARVDEVGALLRHADVFDVDAQEAQLALGAVASAIERWREVVARNGIVATEIARFHAAFDGGHGALVQAISHI